MIPHCVRNDREMGVNGGAVGGDCQSPLQEPGALSPPLLSAEGWVAFGGGGGLFVAGEVAYLG